MGGRTPFGGGDLAQRGDTAARPGAQNGQRPGDVQPDGDLHAGPAVRRVRLPCSMTVNQRPSSSAIGSGSSATWPANQCAVPTLTHRP